MKPLFVVRLLLVEHYGKVMDYAMAMLVLIRVRYHAIIYNNACINGKVGGSVVYGSVKGSFPMSLLAKTWILTAVSLKNWHWKATMISYMFIVVLANSCMSNQKTGFSENSRIGMNLRELKR